MTVAGFSTNHTYRFNGSLGFRAKFSGFPTGQNNRLGAVNAMKTLVAVTAFATIATITAQAATVADLQFNFSPVSPSSGWFYFHSTGPLGNANNYSPLAWNSRDFRYEISPDIFPAGADYSFFAEGGIIHPGPGSLQGNPGGGYLVFSYTLGADQTGDMIVKGAIAGIEPTSAGKSNGWDILFFVGNRQAGSRIEIPWQYYPQTFSQSLGWLYEGDTIYVAVGPNGIDSYDIAQLSLSVETNDGGRQIRQSFRLKGPFLPNSVFGGETRQSVAQAILAQIGARATAGGQAH